MDNLDEFMANCIQEMSDEELAIFSESVNEAFILELKEEQNSKKHKKAIEQ